MNRPSFLIPILRNSSLSFYLKVILPQTVRNQVFSGIFFTFFALSLGHIFYATTKKIRRNFFHLIYEYIIAENNRLIFTLCGYRFYQFLISEQSSCSFQVVTHRNERKFPINLRHSTQQKVCPIKRTFNCSERML